MPPVAHTRTRLRGYVTLRTYPGGKFMPEPSGADLITLRNEGGLLLIGAASQLDIVQARDSNQARWEFKVDPGDAMIPAETYPGKVAPVELTLQRTDLYDTNLIEAFGIKTGYMLAKQYKPLILFVEQPAPENDDGTPITVKTESGKEIPFKSRTLIIDGCWFNNLPMQYQIDETDLKYVAEVTMIGRKVFEQT